MGKIGPDGCLMIGGPIDGAVLPASEVGDFALEWSATGSKTRHLYKYAGDKSREPLIYAYRYVGVVEEAKK